MSDQVGSSTNLATNAVNVTTKSSPVEVINVLELSASQSKKILFADNEKSRQSRANKRYREKVKQQKFDLVAKHVKNAKKG